MSMDAAAKSLRDAAKRGDRDAARSLLALPSEGSDPGPSATAAVMLIAAAGADGKTALHHAARKGRIGVVGLFLMLMQKCTDAAAVAACVNAKTADGETALHLSCAKGHLEVVRALVATEPVDVAIKDGEGRTALRVAKEGRWRDCHAAIASRMKDGYRRPSEASQLVLWGMAGDAEPRTRSPSAPPRPPAGSGASAASVEATVNGGAAGAPAAATQAPAPKLLWEASRNGDAARVKQLLEMQRAGKPYEAACFEDGAAPDKPSALMIDVNMGLNNITPLTHACLGGRVDVVRELLTHPDVAVDRTTCRASGGDFEAETAAYRTGFGTSIHDENGLVGATPLHIATSAATTSSATEEDCLGVVKLLMAHPKVDVSAKCRQKRTPLGWACHHGNLPCVRELMPVSDDVFGAPDPSIPPWELGQTVMQIACKRPAPAVVEFLLDVEPADKISLVPRGNGDDAEPPLHVLIRHGARAASAAVRMVGDKRMTAEFINSTQAMGRRTPLHEACLAAPLPLGGAGAAAASPPLPDPSVDVVGALLASPLLSRKALRDVDGEGNTVLHVACERGDLATATRLIARMRAGPGPDDLPWSEEARCGNESEPSDGEDEDGSKGRVGRVLNLPNGDNQTPLFLALASGNADLVSLILAQPGGVTAEGFNLARRDGSPPLFLTAIMLGKVPAARVPILKLALGDDRAAVDGLAKGRTLLHHLCAGFAIGSNKKRCDTKAVVAALKAVRRRFQSKRKMAAFAGRDEDGRTPLHVAILGGFGDAVAALLKDPAVDPSVRDGEGASALDLAFRACTAPDAPTPGPDDGIVRALLADTRIDLSAERLRYHMWGEYRVPDSGVTAPAEDPLERLPAALRDAVRETMLDRVGEAPRSEAEAADESIEAAPGADLAGAEAVGGAAAAPVTTSSVVSTPAASAATADADADADADAAAPAPATGGDEGASGPTGTEEPQGAA